MATKKKTPKVKAETETLPASLPVDAVDAISEEFIPAPIQVESPVVQPEIKKLSIAEQTVFLTTHFSVPGNTKRVKNENVRIKMDDSLVQTEDTATIKDGEIVAPDKELVKAQKVLLESEELKNITKADMAVRLWLESQTLPFEMRVRLLPLSNLDKVRAKLLAYQNDERPALVQTFLNAYPDLLLKAKERLSPLGLFEESDYLTVHEMALKFSFDYALRSYETPEALKLKGLYEEESAKAKKQMAAVVEDITLMRRQLLLDTVQKLQDALTPNPDGKPKRVFQSQVANITEFLDSFADLDVTNDTELAAIVEKAKALTSGVSADALRKDTAFKETVHSNMAGLTAELAKLVEVTPGRKFRLDD